MTIFGKCCFMSYGAEETRQIKQFVSHPQRLVLVFAALPSIIASGISAAENRDV